MKNLRRGCYSGLFLIAFTFLLVSCTVNQQKVSLNQEVKPEAPDSNSNAGNFDATEFLRNKELWGRQNIKNYGMVVEARNSSNTARQVKINVENRQAKSISKLDAADNGSGKPYKAFETIEKIFSIIERESKTPHDVLKINYDSTLGYPSQVISNESLRIADEEFSIKIISLRAQ